MKHLDFDICNIDKENEFTSTGEKIFCHVEVIEKLRDKKRGQPARKLAKDKDWWTKKFEENRWRVEKFSDNFKRLKKNWVNKYSGSNGFFILEKTKT